MKQLLTFIMVMFAFSVTAMEALPTKQDTPVPVTLTHFDGLVDGDAIYLYWGTDTEINNSHFVVGAKHESGDEILLKVLSQAESGNSVDHLSYSYSIQDCKDGQWMIWLEQYDYDGQRTVYDDLKKVLTIRNEGLPSYRIVKNYLYVEEGTVRVYDIVNRKVDEFQGKRHLDYPTGIYTFVGDNFQLRLYLPLISK